MEEEEEEKEKVEEEEKVEVEEVVVSLLPLDESSQQLLPRMLLSGDAGQPQRRSDGVDQLQRRSKAARVDLVGVRVGARVRVRVGFECGFGSGARSGSRVGFGFGLELYASTVWTPSRNAWRSRT